jgi:hypothetical protein
MQKVACIPVCVTQFWRRDNRGPGRPRPGATAARGDRGPGRPQSSTAAGFVIPKTFFLV